MNISGMGRGRQWAGAAFGAALCMAGISAYGGDGGGIAPAASTGQPPPTTDGAAPDAICTGGAADRYDIINLAAGMGYRSRMNIRGQAAFEYVSLTGRLRVGYFDGDSVSDISPPGSQTAQLGDMNEHGEVAEHASLPYNGSFSLMPFRWSRAAGWTLLPVLNRELPSFASAINDQGVIAGASAIRPERYVYRPVRWSAANTLMPLPVPAGYGESVAYDLNAQGASTGAAVDQAGLARTYIWDAAGRAIDLGSLGAAQAAGLLNNRRGEIAGWLNLFGPDFQAFVWSPDTGVARAGLHTIAAELNNAGELVGRIYNPDTGVDHAYVFSRALGLRDLHRAPFTSSEALHVNDRGTVVGQMANNTPGAFTQRAYRWARSGEAVDLTTRLLDPPDGLVVTQALRISPTGDIIANSNAGLVLLRRGGGTDAPVLGPISVPDRSPTGQPVPLALSFRDRNKRDTHGATVDWGDGSGPQAAGISERDGRGQLSAAHSYARGGDYKVVVRVTDSTGRTTAQARDIHVIQTCGPRLVGAGSLPAAAGGATQAPLLFQLAAPLEPSCGNTANTGTIGTTGNTSAFTFELQGRLAFKGERLDHVTRNGNTVLLEGSGKLDGQSGYRFIVEARAGQQGGALETDRLTVRIEPIDPSGGASAERGRPPVLSYGVAETGTNAAPAAHEGILSPGTLRLFE
jgi:uncharacterized membrane protein